MEIKKYIDESMITPLQAQIDELKNQIENSGSVTKEYTYTYNGDRDDENNQWIVNGSGHKMYVKMGEIPEGTMNIVGSGITVTNHTNSSLTVHFEVTEEHLTRELSMYDGTMVAVATQTGFTQIL